MKRFRRGSENPYIKTSSYSTSYIPPERKAVNRKEEANHSTQVVKLSPGTPEYREAEREIELKKRQNKNRHDEIESRGNKLVIGKIIAEKPSKPVEEFDPEIIEEFKKEIQREKNNKKHEINKNIEGILYDNITYNDIQNRLNSVKDLLEIDFADEYAWENNMPIFLKTFKKWLDYNPEAEVIEQVSKDFGELMIQASQVNLTNKKMQEFHKIKNQLLNALSEFIEYQDIIDKDSLEYLEKIKELKVMKNQTRIYTTQESKFIKKNIQLALCEFLNIRNRIVKQEHLLMVIRDLSHDKLDIQEI